MIDLTPKQAEILEILVKQGEKTAPEIRDLTGYDAGGILNRLQSKAMAFRVGLSDNGAAILWSAYPLTQEHVVRKIHPAITGRLVLDENGRTVSPQVEREAWKRIRGPLVGSSDLAALLGKDEYRGPWQVWDRIVLGQWEEVDHADIRRGNRQEPNAIACFEEQFGLETQEVGMIYHHSDERIVSDLDAVVLRPDEWPEAICDNALWDHVRQECKGPGALEVKVPRTARFFQYRDEGMLVSHAIQMQHHLEVAGLEWGVLTFYNPEYDICVAFPMVVEPRIGKWIREAIPAWYKAHVETRTRPQRPLPDPPKWPKIPPGEAKVRTDAEWRDAAYLLALRHHELVEAQAAYDQTEEQLLALLSDDAEDNNVVGSNVVVRRWETKGQRRFDAKAFLADVLKHQQSGDTEALLALDPTDDEYFYQTAPREKVEVKVLGAHPEE